MHINLSRWKPKYLPGQAMAVQMASWALREEREEKLERERESESGCWQQNQLIEWVDNSYADWVALLW